jgi:hypothetical protein
MNPDDPLGLLGGSPQKKAETADPLGLITKPKLPTKLDRETKCCNASPRGHRRSRPELRAQALGGLASLAHDIPGAEALQAGARSLSFATRNGQAEQIRFRTYSSR